MDVYRNILEAVKGVQVTSNTSVKDMMLVSDLVQAQAQGLVKGMRVLRVTYSDDGGCEMTGEINVGQEGEFLLSALNDSEVKVKDDYPEFDWVAMRNELEKRKSELAAIKAQYALLKKNFSRKKEELMATNQKLIQAEEKLKLSGLEKDELKVALNTTQKELNKTRDIIDNLSRSLHNREIDIAVKDKELALTKHYLLEKRGNL